MRVLLIQPAKASVTIGGEDLFVFEPLALEYVAAGVAQDHDVRILDMRLDKDLQRVLSEFSPDVVGLTAYTVHVKTVRVLCETVKAWNAETLTVVGGHHATILPADFTSPHIDLIVMGEGVAPFAEIVRRRERGEAFGGIPGVAYAEAGRLIVTDAEPLTDLDAVPPPQRRFTAAYRRDYYCEWMRPLASLRTSKGCPYRCSFCALWKLTGGKYLGRKPETIVEELGQIEEDFVFFDDDESLIDAPRMMALARQIERAGLRKRYFLYGRSDTIARHPDLLEAWRGIGLERVFVGLEFFRDQDLRDVHKGSTVEDNQAAVRLLQSLGIEVFASLIVRPEFSKEDFAALRDYCRDLDLNFATFGVLTPLPGTDFYQQVAEQMILRDYDYFDFVHTLLPTKLPREEFYACYADLAVGAIPPGKVLSFLRKYPWREVPGVVRKLNWIKHTIRHVYRDYETTAPTVAPSPAPCPD